MGKSYGNCKYFNKVIKNTMLIKISMYMFRNVIKLSLILI